MKNKKKVWVTAKDVRARYGGRSEMTLWRWGRDPDLDFPGCVYINGRRFWDEAELDAFDERLVRRALLAPKAAVPAQLASSPSSIETPKAKRRIADTAAPPTRKQRVSA